MHATSSRSKQTAFFLTTLAASALLASGCTILQEDRIDYKSAERGSTLDVPPDLTQLNRDSRYNLPAGEPITASGYKAGAAAPSATSGTATSSVGDVRVERSGNQRWLVVERPADKLWSPVRDFWRDNGFVLERDQEGLGIMETDWAENRAKLPQDFIRNTIGKVFDGLYDTGERDRFRTRLERNAVGGTEIYISHKGMIEVYTSSQNEQTAWQPRPSDVELEAEFLRRLMVKLGASEVQAKAAVVSTNPSASARLTTVDKQSVVQLDDGFEGAWRRVGLSLDRTGFTVEDRDRSQGLFFVRYVPFTAASADKKPGFLGRIFGRSQAQPTPAKYRVLVRGASEASSTVAVQTANGEPDTSSNAKRILELLAQDLK